MVVYLFARGLLVLLVKRIESQAVTRVFWPKVQKCMKKKLNLSLRECDFEKWHAPRLHQLCREEARSRQSTLAHGISKETVEHVHKSLQFGLRLALLGEKKSEIIAPRPIQSSTSTLLDEADEYSQEILDFADVRQHSQCLKTTNGFSRPAPTRKVLDDRGFYQRQFLMTPPSRQDGGRSLHKVMSAPSDLHDSSSLWSDDTEIIRAPAHDGTESDWAKRVFETLPVRVLGPSLCFGASIPRSSSKASVHQGSSTASRQPVASTNGRRGSKSSVGTSVNERRGSISSVGLQSSKESVVSSRRSSKISMRRNSKESVSAAFAMDGGVDDLNDLEWLTQLKRQHSKGASDVASCAHKLKLPLATVQDAAAIFTRYAKLPGISQDEHVLRDGFLDAGCLEMMCCNLAEKAKLGLPLDQCKQKIMGEVDMDKIGTLDFMEFADWYDKRAFSDYMNLSAEDIELRKIGAELGISNSDMDDYKKVFNKYDADRSGRIDFAEFSQMMDSLLKVPKGQQLPQSRISQWWKEVDLDGNGNVDLREFVTFYTTHFVGSDTPIEDYYRSIRRSSLY